MRRCYWLWMLFFFVGEAVAMPIGLGAAGRYNLLVFGDMEGYYSDVEGRMAVGGDLVLRHYAVGRLLGGDADFTDTLVVGGDLSFHDGRVYHGNARYGGTADVRRVGFYADDPGRPTGALQPGNPLDFTALQEDLSLRSSAWAGLTPNGTVWRENADDEDVNPGWGLYLQGDDPRLNVFDLPADWLGGAYGFWLDAPLQSTILINVDGILAEMDNFGFYRKVDGGWLRLPDDPAGRHDGSLTRRVLFNFFNAESLAIHNVGVKGSVLAPWADLSFYDAHVDGNLIVGSLAAPPVGQCGNTQVERCTGQVNNYLFISEPPVGAIFLLGGVAVFVFTRWRRTERGVDRC